MLLACAYLCGMGVSRSMLLGFAVVLGGGCAVAHAVGGGGAPAGSAAAPDSPAGPMADAGSLTAEGIMARVAGNQDRSEAERAHYVYVQHADVSSRKGKTVMCQEVTESRVTPTSTGWHAELLTLKGRLLVKHRYETYTALRPADHGGNTHVEEGPDSLSLSVGDDATDRDLVENMRGNLTRDEDSKDGIDRRLFPLSSTAQRDYVFQLVGREHVNGREVFHVEFRPKDKGEFGWKGDAFIDTEAFEPVAVSTAMARKIPFAVRTLLGTSVPGLGFSIVYAPQPDGVWFPVSLGTEFKLHVLFFFSREVVIHAENRSFEKTHVRSEMVPVAGATGLPE